VFSPFGPSVRELAVQALSSVEGGYDLLAPKFDHTPFRTHDGVLDATAAALRPLGPFGPGLDVCCGTGAGMRVLESVCQGPIVGADFSAERPALFTGVHRALRPGGVFAIPAGAPPPVTSAWYWALAGFDLAMRVRNVLWRPAFVMYYRTCPLHAVHDDLLASGFTVTTVPLAALGRREDGSPRFRLVLARKAGTPATDKPGSLGQLTRRLGR